MPFSTNEQRAQREAARLGPSAWSVMALLQLHTAQGRAFLLICEATLTATLYLVIQKVNRTAGSVCATGLRRPSLVGAMAALPTWLKLLHLLPITPGSPGACHYVQRWGLGPSNTLISLSGKMKLIKLNINHI